MISREFLPGVYNFSEDVALNNARNIQKNLHPCPFFGVLVTAATVVAHDSTTQGLGSCAAGKSVFAKLLTEGVNNVSLSQAQTRVSKESLLSAANSSGP